MNNGNRLFCYIQALIMNELIAAVFHHKIKESWSPMTDMKQIQVLRQLLLGAVTSSFLQTVPFPLRGWAPKGKWCSPFNFAGLLFQPSTFLLACLIPWWFMFCLSDICLYGHRYRQNVLELLVQVMATSSDTSFEVNTLFAVIRLVNAVSHDPNSMASCLIHITFQG